jgi:hypothetical protein
MRRKFSGDTMEIVQNAMPHRSDETGPVLDYGLRDIDTLHHVCDG